MEKSGGRKANFMKYEKLLLATLGKKHPVIFSATKDAKTKKLKNSAWRAIEDDFHSDVNVQHCSLDSLKSCMHSMIQKAKEDDARCTVKSSDKLVVEVLQSLWMISASSLKRLCLRHLPH